MNAETGGAATGGQAPVAVTGIGCRTPGARDHREFFDNLCLGVSSIREVDPERWNPADFYCPDISVPGKTVSKWCGQIEEPYGFDSEFFLVSPKTARLMDPQQRLLLEETWHCIEDSGTPLRALQEGRTMIFAGVASRDHLQQAREPGITVEAHTTFGGSDYMLANRLSHTFGLRGHSMAIDAACASSAVGIHLGIRALLAGDGDFVLAGGVLLNLHPWKYISYSKARMLSPTGLCRTFDKDADGFVPGDGAVMVMLRRLDDAVRDGDHIYGLLMGSAVNHNGAGGTITAPSAAAQQDVMTAALDQAGFDRSTVTYVEAHGTGTPLGDPAEMEALHRVMSGAPREDGGCWIGSVKPNIGHLEAASGAVGLVKVLMMMKHRRIPPSIHLTTVNPLIKIDDGVLRLVREATDWTPTGDQPLRAGASSFGGGGVNAHLCVEEYRPGADHDNDVTEPGTPQPFLLSAASPTSLDRLLARWRAGLADNGWIRGGVTDICATLATGREHSAVRTGGLVSTMEDVAALVAARPAPAMAGSQPEWALRVGELEVPAPAQLAGLLGSPPFAAVLTVMRAEAPESRRKLAAFRRGAGGAGGRFLLTYLVLRVLRDLGLRPATVTGHGLGVWPALAATGVLDWPAGLALARGETSTVGLRAPEVPLVHAATGRIACPYLVDEEYIGELLDGLVVDPEVATAVAHRAAPSVGSQWVVRRALDEWNRVLDSRGRPEWRIPADEAGLAAADAADPRAVLIRVLALENAFDQLNREWKLSLDRLVSDARMTELLSLLASSLLSADSLLGLLIGDAAERAATAGQLRRDIARCTASFDGRFPVLQTRARMPVGFDTAAAWAPDAAPDAVDPRPPAVDVAGPGTLPVTVGAAPVIEDGAGHVAIAEPQALADHLATPLFQLWRRGVAVDWHRFYAGRRTHKVSLPTTEFVRTVQRQVPTGPAVRRETRGVRLVELNAEWVPEDGQTIPVEQPDAMVVAPAALIEEVRTAARAALPGYRLAFAGIGKHYRHESPDVWTVGAEQDDWDRLFADLAGQGMRPRYAVRLSDPEGADLTRQIEDRAVVPFLLAQQLLRLRDGLPALILDVIPDGGVADIGVALGRCLPWESGTVRLRSLTMDSAPTAAETWHRVAEEFGTSGDDVIRYDSGIRHARRFAIREPELPVAAAEPAVRPGGVYLVTGGRGGIGQAVAAHLLSVPGVRVALAGRSLMTTELACDLATLTEAAGDRIAYLPADVSDLESTLRLVADVRHRFGPVNGVVHAAGVLRDGYLANKSLADLRAVLAPKMQGAANLDLALADEPLDFFALFSSLAAVTGNPGQTDYAVANAFMEAFAVEREERRAAGACQGHTVAIGWSWWEAGGMTVPDASGAVYHPRNGFAPMPAAVGLKALEAALRGGPARRLFMYGDPQQALPLCHGDSGTPAPEPQASPGEEPSGPWASQYIGSLFSELLGMPEQDIDPARGLDSYGLDSIVVRNFNTRVERDLGPIPHTLLFECRTLDQVAAVLASRFPGIASPKASAAPTPAAAHARADTPMTSTTAWTGSTLPQDGGQEPMAIIGISGRYPQAPDLDAFWRNLAAGRDCVTEIPASRWDYRERFTEDPEAGTYCKWGGFLDGVDRFDPLFFNISPREAELVDPQERLFLQTAWHAFEDAGYPPARLGSPDAADDRSVGVFAGVTTQSYMLWGPDQWRRGNMVMPTSTLWSVANRVSYCLDLHGPSMPVDTACASSLTALHLACESLARGECRLALVGAVNLYLHPSKYDWLCQLQMLSRDGRCHTFGERADGFVPGEGVGAVILKPLSDAIGDGDRVLAVIRGSATNHGGRTSGFTVPNPNAQAELVARAMRAAGPDGSGAHGGISYLEAHGTGTSLGDPIEIAGLGKAFDKLGFRFNGEGCAIGSVKTNIGHLEAAAGLAGLTKVLLQLRHRQLVPSLHAIPPNPSIDFAAAPLRVQTALEPWVRRRRADGSELPLRAGISAFGAGGANAHVVVEEYLGPQCSRSAQPGDHLIVVSAKDPDRLREHCRNLARSIQAQADDVTLAEVAYQLQVRRERLPERLALLVSTADTLVLALDAVAAGRDPDVPFWSRTSRREPANAPNELTELARAWVAGTEVQWEARHPQPLRHVTLPGYPFAAERYWIPEAEPEPGTEITAGHPFLTTGAAASGTFTARFTGDEFFLDDHRVHGDRIFPAVGYLEMVRAAATAAGHQVRGLSGNVWAAPITVPSPQSIHIELSDGPRGARYQVFSHDSRGERVVHGQGRVDSSGGRVKPERLDVASIRARCPQTLPGADYYRWLHSLGLQLGQAYQGVQALRWGDQELLSEYRLPDSVVTGADRFVLHPSALDAAIQGALWLLRQHDGLDHLHLPFAMGSCEVFGPTSRDGFARVVVRASSDTGKKLDIQVADAAGNVVVRIRDFWLRRWQTAEPQQPMLPGTFLQPEWVTDVPSAIPETPRTAGTARTLILAPSSAAGRLLTAELERAETEPVTVLLPGTDIASAIDSPHATGTPHRVVYAWPHAAFTGTAASAAAQVSDGFMPLFHLVRAVLRVSGKAPVQVVCAYPSPDTGAPAYRALGGFLRSASRENPRLAHRLVELAEDEFTELAEGRGRAAERLAAEMRGLPGAPNEVRYRAGGRQVRRWRRISPPPVTRPAAVRPGGTYLVSGGAGGLGALVARWLADTASARVVLVGRSSLGARAEAVLDRVRDAGGDGRYVSANVATAEGAQAAVLAAREVYGELHGLFHAAAVLRDGYLPNLDPGQMAEVLAPKVDGTLYLDAATCGEPLDFFCLFSSLAGPLGSVAQAAYAYANSFLDEFAYWREQQQQSGLRPGRTMSIDWPLWADGGMTVDDEVRESVWRQFGMRPLDSATGLGALATILDNLTGQIAYTQADGSRLAGQLGEDTDPPRPGAAPSGAGLPEPQLVETLTHTVAEIVKLDPGRIDPGEQIGGYGFDSLAFNRLANQVNKALDLDLTPATFFEYTTIADLAAHILERYPEELAARLATSAPEEQPPAAPVSADNLTSEPAAAPIVPAREPIAIVGMYGLMPGSRDLADFWSHLDNGDDLVTEVPQDRWDWRDYYSATPGAPDKTTSKWGAFLPEVDKFDARFFGISPREADLMDPQQRLFLETVYRTIEEAGYAPSDLAQGRTGLFVGVASHDYYDLQREARLPVEAYTTTGYFHSILANRISYLLGLKGPSVPVDAACSSSLVAVRSAIESIWVGSSDVAIAGGINLLISPMIYISFSRAGMLSPTGRCRTFDEGADGYVRGEGAGALLLKPLSRALRDGDHIHAVIRGSAVNHGGRVNTLTTPNPNAQADLIVSAFEEAGVDPASVGYMEMHGTGTALGDPIEVNGLKKAFRDLRRRASQPELTDQGTLIGSVKSNIGHLEAAAGMAGMFKVILAMRHDRIPGNLHVNDVNPHIQLDGSPLRIARVTEAWPKRHDPGTGTELPRRGGVSSFGFGGINAHVLLEESVPARRSADPEGAEHLLVLSARTPEQLAERARDLAVFLDTRTDPSDLSGTACADIESGLADIASQLLHVPAADVPLGETFEDLGLGLPRLRHLQDRIADRYPGAPGVLVLPTDTLASVAARISAQQVPAAGIPLRDVAYTLQVGREHMTCRLALVADSAGAAAAALRRFGQSGDLPKRGYSGEVDAARRGTPAAPSGDLTQLAEHWIHGGEVNWARLYQGDRPRRMSLPTYPFARVRHWIATPAATARSQSAPWITFTEQTGDLSGGLVCRTRLSATDPVVREHRVRGESVLPGVGHLELVHAAVARAVPEATRLARVVWLRQLAVPDPGRDIAVHLRRVGSTVEYQVQATEDAQTVTYSQGAWETPTSRADPVPRRSLQELRDRCPRLLDTEGLYGRLGAQGIDYGPFFRGLREIREGEGEVFATAEMAAAGTAFTFHPTLMDAALQAIAALDSDGEAPAPARLPFAMEEMRAYGPLGASCHVHVRARSKDGYDIDLMDADGRVAVEMREVSVRPVAVREEGTAPALSLYASYWEQRPAAAAAPPAGHGTCLVIHPAGDFGLARDLAAAWPATQAWTWRLSDHDRDLGDRAAEVDVADMAALARRLRNLGPVQHVWFLGGLCESDGGGDPAPALFSVVKALAEADQIQSVETLRVLVNGVHDVAGRRTTNPAAGALVGFVKSFGKEYPRIATSCLDIGVPAGGALAGPDRAALVHAVLAEPAGDGSAGDDEVALVDGCRYVKRLRPVEPASSGRPVFRERGTYLVVGGGSGIGLALARHLAATRRARLVLVGRSPQNTEIAAELGELAQLGAEAVYRSADITDPVRLAAILAETRKRFGRIHGVVHAAMVLRDGIIERMDAGAFQEVLAPKARGTEVLGELLAGDKLDFLLHFSSVQSFTGAPGQANYAAASTAQDAYARLLASRAGYPVKVVNWGYWGAVGRVATEGYRRSVAARGFHPVGTAEGMNAVERILATDETQVVALKAEPEVLTAIGVREQETAPPTRVEANVAPLPASDAEERERAAGEDYIAHTLLAALRRAGLFPHAGTGHADLGSVLGALPKYQRLVHALCGILIRHGLVAHHDRQYVLLDGARTGPAPDGALLRQEFPDLAARLDLADACLAGMTQVLSGALPATEVLFPGGSTELVARVYQGDRLGGYCNGIVADQVAAGVREVARENQGRPVRVLEIGAGTGSTTEVVLDRLRTCGIPVTYDFTDVSDAFLRQARRSLAVADPVAIRFRRLDIAAPPAAQGFEPGGCDIVLAGNVIHAVTDVGTALAHVHELLSPGGRLALTEVTQVQAFHTVTFGLLDGWWHYADEASRLESAPLLDVPMWRRRLEHAGFGAVRALGTATVPRALSQRVIVARAAATSPPRTAAREHAAAPEQVTASEETAASQQTRAGEPPRASAAAGSPGAQAEPWLRGLISELTAQTLNMAIEEVTPREPLSSLGVDSIVGVELIDRLNTALGITLKTIVIFDHPTIADLTAFILGQHGETVMARAAAEQPIAPESPVPAPGVPTAPAPAEPVTPSAPGEFRAVRFTKPGSPRQLIIAAIEPAAPAPGEVEIQVKAFPINFSDLLLAKGLYPIMPDYPFTPGVEVSGVVRRTGPGVSAVGPGDEVIALTRPEMGGQASLVLTDQSFVVRKPANVSHEEACGFPAAFLAMYLAFEWAQVRSGERVLIPAATGTNALIAVQLAQLAGAEVVATAGSPAKVDYLAGIGVPDAIDHERADVVAEVLGRTGGRGVDVVINTLGGRAIQQGLSVLAPEGRYVEIAVFGLQSSGPLDLSRLVDNQRFYSLNAKKYFLQHPERRAQYLRTMAEYLESGKVTPSVSHVLPFDRVLDAYTLKEDRATVGRIVVAVPDPVPAPATQTALATAPATWPARPAPLGMPTADIAVIGMAARLPGARDVDELWANLAAGASAIREIPPSRWSNARFFDPDPANLAATYCRCGGFLDDVDCFDAPFFNISGKEAEQTDPQQRVFLEEAWLALEDAGYTGDRLAGQACGVFVGAGASEYLTRMNQAGAVKQAQAFWGNEASILAARISYFLNLKGPSIAVNTACSSSLVALHLACQSLLSGETSMALAGGSFITLTPDYFIVASNGNMVSPEGRCKTFDASANGFGPGEGVGVLVLKPLDQALRDGDQIHGVIKGTAINQDGRTNGITAPSGLAQTEVELAAYRRAGIDPATIGYVEAHGTGTPLGDPIEVEALTNAFRAHTDRKGFCAIGSVKTNIGHTAAAAGVAGVIKVLLSFRHGKIPPSRNFERPNPLIDFADSPFFVNTVLRDWSSDPARPRRAAVSGFGFSGTNAHVVLEEAPHRARTVPPSRSAVAVPVSAHTPSALDARLDRLAVWLDGPGTAYSLSEIGYNMQIFREHWPVRAVFLARDRADLARQIRDRVPLMQRGGDVADLATRYLAGQDVDWLAWWADASCDRIPLPGFQFDRHRFWFTDVDTVYGDGGDPASAAQAIRFQPVTSSGNGVVAVRTILTGQEPYLRDHLVHGRKVLPGVAYPELARRAAQAAGLQAGSLVTGLHWLHPLEVDDSPVDVAVHFRHDNDGLDFEFRSDSGTAELVHARGLLGSSDADADGAARVDLRAVTEHCPRIVPVAEYYGKIRALGLVHGPALTSIQEIRVGEGALLARLRLPAAIGTERDGFDLHPALLDGALQALGAFDGVPDRLLLPRSVAAVKQSGALPDECFAYVTTSAQPSGGGRAFDIRLLDEHGRELASLHHLTITRATDREPESGPPHAALQTLLHRLRAGEITEDEAELAMEAFLAG